mmetsp:Transcript_70087/g.157288  ORF Transcript_70087/g.157288 Transcript_70087/m.157288 type:complete len:85 (+) Transcript_70087:460-714(+)
MIWSPDLGTIGQTAAKACTPRCFLDSRRHSLPIFQSSHQVSPSSSGSHQSNRFVQLPILALHVLVGESMPAEAIGCDKGQLGQH